MDLLLLNSELLTELNKNNAITIFSKNNKSCKNYFFVPNIGLQIYNAKVTWIDPYKKNMSFSINKHENPHLIKLLYYINNSLISVYEKSSGKTNISWFFFEKGDYIYIRTYLPNLKGKYHINSIYNNEQCEFIIPRKDCVFMSITIYIKNIWEDINGAGFNIELKETKN